MPEPHPSPTPPAAPPTPGEDAPVLVVLPPGDEQAPKWVPTRTALVALARLLRAADHDSGPADAPEGRP